MSGVTLLDHMFQTVPYLRVVKAGEGFTFNGKALKRNDIIKIPDTFGQSTINPAFVAFAYSEAAKSNRELKQMPDMVFNPFQRNFGHQAFVLDPDKKKEYVDYFTVHLFKEDIDAVYDGETKWEDD